MRTAFRRGAVVLAVTAAASAQADQTADPGRFDLGRIEVVEVTGQRSSDWFEPFAPTLGIEDLRLFDRENIADAVSLLPGVNVQNVGARNERLIFVRGFNSRQVPLFIDGIPVYVPYDGNIDLSRLTTADIAEVSVSKGFTSMLFGANTLGGSVNVVTRRPSENYQLDAGGTIGFDRSSDQNTRNVYLNAGTNQGLWYAQFGTSFYEQDYFKLPDDFEPTPVEDGGRRNNSASQDIKVSFKVGLTPNETDEYAISYQNQQGGKDTPPYAGTVPGVNARFWRWPEYDKESLYFIGRKALGDAHYARVRLYYDKFDNTLRSFDDDTYTTQNRPFAFKSVYDDYSWGSSVELGTAALPQHDLRIAAHYKVDVHRETDNDGAPQERFEDEWFSIGAEDRYTFLDGWTLLAGISYDQLEGKQADDIASGPGAQFDLTSESAVNAQGGLLYAFSETLSGRFSVSRRTRFPTIKDRYSFRLGSALPNPDLEQEAAVNLELGLDGQNALAAGRISVSWSAAVFHSKIDDAIENVTIDPSQCSRPPCFQLQNIGEQTNQGLEAMFTADLGARWTWHFNYTYLDKDNDSNPDIRPLDVPEHSLFSYLRFMPTVDWELLASVEYGSRRFSSTTGDRVADSFVLGTAKAIWRPMPHLQLEGGVRNLADELYAYEEGFYEPGRSYYATLRWQY
jgi:iron complex outermembrane receptor protein